MRAGADIGRRAGYLRVSVRTQRDPNGNRYLQRFPNTRRDAPPYHLAAIAHRARDGIALVPAERFRAPAVALAQVLAAIRQAAGLIAVRIASQAQLERIELGGHSQFVDSAFECMDTGRGARAAHVAGGRKIEPRQLVRVSRSGAGVEQARPRGLVAMEVLELRCHRDRVMGDSIECSVSS